MDSPLMVQVCQGTPLIQQPPPFPVPPSPPNLIMSTPPPPLISGPPPPIAVCPTSPMIPCAPMAYNTSTPIAAHPVPVFPVPPVQEPELATPREATTPNTREGKERGRNQRFNKPPRFQRLESAKAGNFSHSRYIW